MRILKILLGAFAGLITGGVVGWLLFALLLIGREDDFGEEGGWALPIQAFLLSLIGGPIIGAFVAARLTKRDDREARVRDLW
jgi:hypothetical protein